MNQTTQLFRTALILFLLVGFIGTGCAEKADTGITPSAPGKSTTPDDEDPPGGGGSEIPNPTPTPDLANPTPTPTPTPTPPPGTGTACTPIDAIADFATLDNDGMDKQRYSVGEELIFGIALKRGGYYVLLSVDAAKNVSILFPNDKAGLRALRTAGSFELPNENDRFVFNITRPKGLQTIRLMYIGAAPSVDLVTLDTSSYKDKAGLDALTALIGKSLGSGSSNICDYADTSITIL